MFFLVCFIYTAIAQGITYYVATTGTDGPSCGTQREPCATINQVIDNYPGASFTVSIAAGNYTPTSILLQRDASVIFQGAGNPMLTPVWTDDNFISTYALYEFHDLTINLTGYATQFSLLQSGTQSAGFYNVNIIYSEFPIGTFIELFSGGCLMVSNVTVAGAKNDGYFILDLSNEGELSNITVTGSQFSHIMYGEVGSFLQFNAYGPAYVLLNSTTFDGITADLFFIGYWAMDVDQTVIISNNVFNNINTQEFPSVYFENDRQCVIFVDNTTWNDVYSPSTSGALETLGSDDGSDHNISFSNLKFTGCFGLYAGAVFVGYNSLNLSNCVFANNSGKLGNDIVQALDSGSSQFGYSVINSTSSSLLPKAVIWYVSTHSVTDISSYLPDPSEANIRPSAHADDSASPTFGRKIRKKN